MNDVQTAPAYVVGPEGERLTRDKLPKATTRWTPRRKAQVVAAVAGGLLSVEEACRDYALSLEEFAEWARLIDAGGVSGLRVTRPPSRVATHGDALEGSTTVSLTTTVPRPQERRTHARSLSIFRIGKLSFADGEELCRVRNLSAGGMAVELGAPREVGEPVTVEICEGRAATGKIAWVREHSAGIKFDSEVDIGLFLTRRPQMIGQVARAPRVNLDCSARVTIGKYQYYATVRDISQSGIKLRVDDEQPTGAVATISIDGLRPIRGVVAWHRAQMIGVMFDQAIPFEELAEWLARRAWRHAGTDEAGHRHSTAQVIHLRAAG